MIRIMIAGLSACGAMLAGCAGDTQDLDATAQGLAAEQADAPQPFEVRLTGAATAEAVIPQIVEAGREQLAAACEQKPAATVRIYNPLASGDYADVACAPILHSGGSVGQAGEALTDGAEHIGRVQQEIGPISLVGCGLMAIGGPVFANRVICPRGTTAENRADCDSATTFGGAGLGILCLVLPF